MLDSHWLPSRQCIRTWGPLNVQRKVMHGAESRLNVLRYVMHVLRYGAESRLNVLR